MNLKKESEKNLRLGTYHDLYVPNDSLLSANVFETF